ncbi:hypothetical protein BGW38_007603 [Lunasporangiospora selenospora]|uniref:Letm1 RBD domain-containing protein n=1 Tax=Lunasporangiospora selenospora TaxID=979761 RepID=A0A9P6KGJ3_9FUNG|nr:hypothetical protein BGW38_007603 [Lunasporangiospora selenospora]
MGLTPRASHPATGVRVSGWMIHQHKINARYMPLATNVYQVSFYSSSNGSGKPVRPSSAPFDDSALKVGSGGAVAPENAVPATAEAVAPPPPKGLGAKAKEFWNKGKEIVIQCKDGVKLLWTNKKIVKELKRSQLEGYAVTRREFQLIHKTDIDIKRLIPFALVFTFATEYIPLIIIFAPQLIPSTCVTASQLDNLRKKTHEKRSTVTEKLIRLNRREITKENLASYNSFVVIAKKYGEGFTYDAIDRAHLSAFCKFMGLNGFGLKSMLKKRLDRHMTYIKEDDLLLQKDGIDSLTFGELQIANEERGMRSLEVSREHLEKSLAYWLKLNLSKDADIPPSLMVFSRMFLLHSTFRSDAAVKK